MNTDVFYLPRIFSKNFCRKVILATLVPALVFCSAAIAGETRTWTRIDGKKLEAELVSVAGKDVSLRLENGRQITIALDKLSARDREFVGKNGIHRARSWPEKVPGPQNFRLKEEPQRGKKSADKKSVVYVTNNFRFTCPFPLDETARDAVGKLYEGTLCAVREMPLPFPRADKRSRGGKDKLNALLVPDMESYYAAGGPQGSAGVFVYNLRKTGKKVRERDINQDRTIVPLPALGIDASGKLAGRNPDSHVLAHEITHQMTCGVLSDAVWANEGFSEYVAYTPYDGDFFNFSEAFARIAEAGKRYNSGWNIPFTLEEFFKMPQAEFYGQTENAARWQVHKNYTLAAMLIAYFFHLDGERGIKNFETFLRELQKNPETAAKKLCGERKNFRELENDFVEAWKNKGVFLNFKK